MKTTFLNFIAVCAVLFSLLVSACHSGTKESAGATDSTNISGVDSSKSKAILTTDASNFLVSSHEVENYVIQLSQLATVGSSNADVKKFASDLVTAHTAIKAKINAIAASADFNLPDSLGSFHQNKLNELNKSKGSEFDLNYINSVVNCHEQAVIDYKAAFNYLKVSKTRTFVNETLPEIQKHLETARNLQKELNK